MRGPHHAEVRVVERRKLVLLEHLGGVDNGGVDQSRGRLRSCLTRAPVLLRQC
jgi:hypothetical protein